MYINWLDPFDCLYSDPSCSYEMDIFKGLCLLLLGVCLAQDPALGGNPGLECQKRKQRHKQRHNNNDDKPLVSDPCGGASPVKGSWSVLPRVKHPFLDIQSMMDRLGETKIKSKKIMDKYVGDYSKRVPFPPGKKTARKMARELGLLNITKKKARKPRTLKQRRRVLKSIYEKFATYRQLLMAIQEDEEHSHVQTLDFEPLNIAIDSVLCTSWILYQNASSRDIVPAKPFHLTEYFCEQANTKLREPRYMRDYVVLKYFEKTVDVVQKEMSNIPQIMETSGNNRGGKRKGGRRKRRHGTSRKRSRKSSL